jgi:hypothetical protein
MCSAKCRAEARKKKRERGQTLIPFPSETTEEEDRERVRAQVREGIFGDKHGADSETGTAEEVPPVAIKITID